MSAVTRRQAVEFYTIELSCLIDGAMFVTMTATSVDEQEPQLLTQEITSQRAGSLDDALVMIRRGMIANLT